ncbi:MAG: hypothetical protein GX799_00820 [Crenarchaeota archaeon]|jgi:hypothetical protein|nr:hypothetical protein [Thermoproteota archaeon]
MPLKKISHLTLGIIAAITGAATFLLLVLPYVLFPQLYNPKANASMGYTTPATLEGWILAISGFILLGITIIFVKLYKNK